MQPKLSRVRLDLAREPQHPAGDRAISYTLIAPLTDDGRIDEAAWRADPSACRVVRNLDGDTQVGHLGHHRAGWRIDYPKTSGLEPEGIFRLEDERITPGEYLSIEREDGMHVFRVVTCAPVQVQ